MNRWRAASLAVVFMLIAGLTAGSFTNFAVTARVDGTCDRGLCGFGGFSPYMLLTFWIPFAAAAALTLAWSYCVTTAGGCRLYVDGPLSAWLGSSQLSWRLRGFGVMRSTHIA